MEVRNGHIQANQAGTFKLQLPILCLLLNPDEWLVDGVGRKYGDCSQDGDRPSDDYYSGYAPC